MANAESSGGGKGAAKGVTAATTAVVRTPERATRPRGGRGGGDGAMIAAASSYEGGLSTAASSPGVQCCLPVSRMMPAGMKRLWRGGRKRTRAQVHFSESVKGVSSSSICGPGSAARRKPTRKYTKTRSTGKSSFYSAISKVELLDSLESGVGGGARDKCTDLAAAYGYIEGAGVEAGAAGAVEGFVSCSCQHPAHHTFDPAMPIARNPMYEDGSYEEMMAHATALIGRWITVLERSESLDPQMVHVGIGKMKRVVMNRLQIQFEAVFIDEKKTLKCWIETPIGSKYTHASLVGSELQDRDPDLGDWTSATKMVDYSTPLYCSGQSVRAMQLERKNPKFGTAFETRAILPDPEFQTVFLYNIRICPPNNAPEINVTRIYKRV